MKTKERLEFEKLLKIRHNFQDQPDEKPVQQDPMDPKLDLTTYDWDQCIADQTEKYNDEEIAKKVCGSIKALYGSKQTLREDFVIPEPEPDEDENTFISRCMGDIVPEYGNDVAAGICYSQWGKK